MCLYLETFNFSDERYFKKQPLEDEEDYLPDPIKTEMYFHDYTLPAMEFHKLVGIVVPKKSEDYQGISQGTL